MKNVIALLATVVFSMAALADNQEPRTDRVLTAAVEAMSDYAGERTSSNREFVHLVAERNVRITIDNIRKKSPIVASMEADGSIKIVGALYDLHSGEGEFLD
ncbi:MAG: carbonic anhydrase [Halioglobus sp.]